MLVVAMLIAAAALVDVNITGPRIAVRWSQNVDAARRTALERKYDLRYAERDQQTTWKYDLGNRSRDNIGALVNDPDVADTQYIDRTALTARGRDVTVRLRSFPYPMSDLFDRSSQLLRLHRSLWLCLVGAALFAVAGSPDRRRRRAVSVAGLLLVGVLALALPIPTTLVHMGDAEQSVQSRSNFARYAAVDYVRFEAHLSYALMGRLDRLFGATDASPARAQITLARGATLWFVLGALAVGFLEQWSPFVVRYLSLALLAPATLMNRTGFLGGLIP